MKDIILMDTLNGNKLNINSKKKETNLITLTKQYTIIFFIFFNCYSFSQINIPILKNYANDFTNTLSKDELYSIETKLKAFDDSTSNQIVFLMISTLNGYSLESFTYETASKNKIGTKENNNGVLFFVAKDDRKMRIEVGYGLEAVLPDALASSILRNEVRPFFRNGEFYSGIISGINAIIKATKGEYKAKKKEKENAFPIFFIILILIIISLFSKRGGRGKGGDGSSVLPLLILSSMSGRSRSSWGGSGGFGGFGGGGFSGGGGSFGGGGASGSW